MAADFDERCSVVVAPVFVFVFFRGVVSLPNIVSVPNINQCSKRVSAFLYLSLSVSLSPTKEGRKEGRKRKKEGMSRLMHAVRRREKWHVLRDYTTNKKEGR